MIHRQRRHADHFVAPYADALTAHARTQPLMFMVPGHAATGAGMSEDLAEFLGEQAIAMDIPQLVDGIDVGPGSAFAQAEALAADAWGAKRTWFLANGSSQGNRLAMLAVAGLTHAGGSTAETQSTNAAAAKPGPRAPHEIAQVAAHVIAQRSAHSSLSDGLILAGLTPLFLAPSFDLQLGIHHGLTPEALDAELTRAAAAGQQVRAAQVVSPSYFGAVSDIAGLAAVAHRHRVPLIVDAAWGAHFGFHDLLPESPSRLGADLVISSTHKMGGSLGQSAMIHLGDGPFTAELEPLIDRAFRLTQTTSASSLLLGSLDIARRSLATRPDLMDRSIALADELREWVGSHAELTDVRGTFKNYPDIVDVDPLRVAIDVTATGLTGYEVRSRLANEHRIYMEIATFGAIVAFFGPGKPLDVERLITALEHVTTRGEHRGDQGNEVDPSSGTPGSDQPTPEIPPLPSPGEARLSPREAHFAETEIVSAADAIGRVSADALAAYPPGIPNIVPGEVITQEAVDFLHAVATSPIGYVRGALDADVSSFRVITG